MMADEAMTGKEIVNLIRKLREEGMSAEKIIEIKKEKFIRDKRLL